MQSTFSGRLDRWAGAAPSLFQVFPGSRFKVYGPESTAECLDDIYQESPPSTHVQNQCTCVSNCACRIDRSIARSLCFSFHSNNYLLEVPQCRSILQSGAQIRDIYILELYNQAFTSGGFVFNDRSHVKLWTSIIFKLKSFAS